MNEPVRAADATDIVELRVPCRAEWVALVRLAIAAVANRAKFSIDEIEDVKLAVAEACTNAIQHATGSESIEIHCAVQPDGLQIIVRDFGHGTHPDQIVSRALDEARVGGLGVFLIRTLMDVVSYDVEADRGTVLTMFKRRTN